MKFAVIAAGEGSRLASEGVGVPKPLAEVKGEKLIDRLIRIFMDNDAEEIVVICNDKTNQVSQHLFQIEEDGLKGRPVSLQFKVKSTPSSMHSFFELSHMLNDGPFVLTTVDTVFREAEFAGYVARFGEALAQGADGLMGVTSFVDDEGSTTATTPLVAIYRPVSTVSRRKCSARSPVALRLVRAGCATFSAPCCAMA